MSAKEFSIRIDPDGVGVLNGHLVNVRGMRTIMEELEISPIETTSKGSGELGWEVAGSVTTFAGEKAQQVFLAVVEAGNKLRKEGRKGYLFDEFLDVVRSFLNH